MDSAPRFRNRILSASFKSIVLLTRYCRLDLSDWHLTVLLQPRTIAAFRTFTVVFQRLSHPALLCALLATCTVARGEAAATELPVIEVHGLGEFRQVQTLKPDDFAPNAPGTSPMRIIGKLAGVNYQASDPFGSYEWGVRISVRGFNQSQMGFTLDDMPLGDMYYSTLNGTYISRALLTENLARIRLSQGTGALETAATANLGGTLQFQSLEPEERSSTTFVQTFGSEAMRRTFLKQESGRLANDGKFYVAAANQISDLWKGSGHQAYDQINAKYTQPIGDKLLTGYYNFSNRQEMDYQDMTKAWINQLGYRWSNYWPNLGAAIANSGSTDACCGAPVGSRNSVNDPLDAAYYYASGVRRDHLGYLSLDGADWRGMVYAHTYRGVSTWATPYKATPGADGTPISERALLYDTLRFGTSGWRSWQLGTHQLSAGFWLEHNSAEQTRAFFPITTAGSRFSPYEIPDLGSAFLTQWAYRFRTDTAQLHLQDTWQVNDRLTLFAGFKSYYNRTTGTPTTDNLGGAPLPAGTLTVADAFLPQFGLKWATGPREEIFVDFGESVRAYQLGGYGLGLSPWAVRNQAAFMAMRDDLRPEQAWTLETGYRFRRSLESSLLRDLQGSISVYHVDFRNRLLNVSPGGSLIAATGGAAILANVGDVTMNGAELSTTLRLRHGWHWYQALSVNRSTYNDDYFDGTTRIATAGKTVVDSPRFIYKSEIAYRQGDLGVFIDADYLSGRYFTYTNDQSVPGRWLANFGASLEFGRVGPLAGSSLQFNVYNLFDTRYIAGMGTGGFTASGDNQTLQVGAPRQFFVSFRAKL